MYYWMHTILVCRYGGDVKKCKCQYDRCICFTVTHTDLSPIVTTAGTTAVPLTVQVLLKTVTELTDVLL